MGLLLAAIWWLYLLGLAALAAFVVVGDRLLSLAAVRFGSAYVGDKFSLRWSVATGLFEMRGLMLGRAVLAIVEPMLGMPIDVEFIRLEVLRVQLPWAFLLKSDKPMLSSVEVAGLQLGLSVNEPEKWLAMRDENLARFQQAVKDAALARVAKADGWTATVVQKLKDLAAARATVAEKKKEKTTEATAQPAIVTPAWQKVVDRIIDSFAIVVSRFAVTIRDDYAASGVGIALERFEIGRANDDAAGNDKRRKRVVRVEEFAIFVNPLARSKKPSYVLLPLTMEIQVHTPYVMQSLLMGQIDPKRVLELDISFPSDVVLQMRPAQVTKLLKLLRPLSFYSDWFQRATALDESTCVELVGAERDEYMELYRQQFQLEYETGFVARLVAGFTNKVEIQERKARLQELEAKVLASRILYLRSIALDWDVPSGGTALPHMSGALKRRKDLRTFINSPLTKYVPEHDYPPMFHSCALSFNLRSFKMQLVENTERLLLSMFACDMCIGMEYVLEKTAPGDAALSLDLKIKRFGIVDERNVDSNAFHRLLDQNPGASHLLSIRMMQTSGGHIDLDVALEDLTLLVILDPLYHCFRVFRPALDEDEATELRYLAYSNLQSPTPVDSLEETMNLTESEERQECSPFLFGKKSIRSLIVSRSCEFCLVGNSTSMESHVLAFTSDITINVVSSYCREAFELELVDVALQPCRISLHDDAIDLQLTHQRTILELEGEGVDLMLGYRLVLSDNDDLRSTCSHSTNQKEFEESTDSRRLKPNGRRKIVLKMSDFAINLSPQDFGVLLNVCSNLFDVAMEDTAATKERVQRKERILTKKRSIDEAQFLQRLRAEFHLRDRDGSGALDAQEISGLIKSVSNFEHLTTEEFNTTVQEFLRMVDRDNSGDVSLKEFETVLGRKKTVYHRLHHSVVSLTGAEFVDTTYARGGVPAFDHTETSKDSEDFWQRYREQVGASQHSLNGTPPEIVQKKIVRAFKNYEYAKNAWVHLVNPSITMSHEKSPWLLTKDMNMGGRSNVIDELLCTFDTKIGMTKQAESKLERLPIFVHTVVSTSLGGFFVRLIDDNVATHVASIELSLVELSIYSNFAIWEGTRATLEDQFKLHLCSAKSDDYGLAKLSFAAHGKYYNSRARQVEPFIDYITGDLDVHKDPVSNVSIRFKTDRYFQMYLSVAFLEVLELFWANFSHLRTLSAHERLQSPHSSGLFWIFNESGVSLKYHVVSNKQSKEHVRVETVSAVVQVSPREAHSCHVLTAHEDKRDSERQRLQEKQLRRAFRNADVNKRGTIETSDIRGILLDVFGGRSKFRMEDRRRSNSRRKNSSEYSALCQPKQQSSVSTEFERFIDDFIEIADPDHSGTVSWDAFKLAVAATRDSTDRFISIEIAGFEHLHNIPLSSIGQTQVYELTRYFEDIQAEKSLPALYRKGVALFNTDDEPSLQNLEKAYACFRRVYEMDPNYEWIDSYYNECKRQYLPVLVAVHISIDGVLGLQVKVTGAEYIRNDTMKPTECLLLDEKSEVSVHNPSHVGENGNEYYYVLPPNGSIPIPLDLVDVGYFAIRQIGETEWSNYLSLSVREQRGYKYLTRYEQREAKRALRENSGGANLSSTEMVSEKMGKDVALPNTNEYVPPGKEIVYPSTSVIDNQPTLVIEKISINDHTLGTWSIVIQPQLLIHNVLPCGVEYCIVQTRDCPSEVLDGSGQFRILGVHEGKNPMKTVKTLGTIDYFEYVSEVNCRHMYVASGQTIHVFGLDLNEPALMKMRLCASESNRAGNWSPTFLVKLNASRDAFNSEVFELRLGDQVNDAPAIVFQQQWQRNSARTINLFAPYWIQNRSGLDLRFRLSKSSTICAVEQHRAYFNGAKEIPMLVNAPATKAMISVRPFQETAHAFEGEFLLSRETKKYLPNFDRVDWSEQQDMSSVGTKGELASSDRSFVLSFEILAAPGQFFRSKIFRISPRVIIVNRVPRPLQVTPLMLDKKLRGSSQRTEAATANVSLKHDESVVVYRFAGSEKHHPGLRLRDVFRDEALPDVGEWSPSVPIRPGDDFTVWTRGSLGDGPACSITFQNLEECLITEIKDVSTEPRYRIENRSTRHSFRYVQSGVKGAEEVVIKPLESHSFVWDDPLAADRKLRVTPLNWKIPTLIDLKHIGPRTMLTSNGMYSEVYIDGSTRVFAVGDTSTYAADRQRAALNDWLSDTLIDVALHGFGLTIVDGHPQETMNLTMETMRIASSAGSRRIVFSLHHFQIDDMTPHSLYPVVLAPIDSGFNSNKREGWVMTSEERPFLSMVIDGTPQLSGIAVVETFELTVHSTVLKLNIDYVLGLVGTIRRFLPTRDEQELMQRFVDVNNTLLSLNLTFRNSSENSSRLMYFTKWSMSPFTFHVVFNSQVKERDGDISSMLGSTIGSIVGGIARARADIVFDQLLYEHRFFYEDDLLYTVIMEIVYKAIRQSYKFVGSLVLHGNPVGLGSAVVEVVDTLADTVRQLKRSTTIQKGDHALLTIQKVVGAPMRSIERVSNHISTMVDEAKSQEHSDDTDKYQRRRRRILKSGAIFGKSLGRGIKGFVKEPMRGAKSNGVKGFAKGVGRGILRLVASPVVGTVVAVDAYSARKNRRMITKTNDSIEERDPIAVLDLHVVRVEGLPRRSNSNIVVRVCEQPTDASPPRIVARYKSSTQDHTGTPTFDESWVIPISSMDTFLEVQVQHKRKPAPKKVLGFVRLSMEDVYRDFERVDAGVLPVDSHNTVQLHHRRRLRGTLLNELVSSRSLVIKYRDKSWKQKADRPSMQRFTADDFEDNLDDYEQNVALMSSRKHTVNKQPSVRTRAYPLHSTMLTDAKIHLRIRYVNTLRFFQTQ